MRTPAWRARALRGAGWIAYAQGAYAPARALFLESLASFEALGLPQVGMLPQDAYLGERPPVLADYLDDEVSAEVTVPVTQKMIMIAGLEVQTAG